MWPWRSYPILRKAIVNLKGGETVFEGLVWARRGGYLVLRNVTVLRAEGKAQSVVVGGEVAIPVGNVEFLQVED